MTHELTMLVLSVVLLLVLTMIQAMANFLVGIPLCVIVGNRDEMPFPKEGIRGRSYRAVMNLAEGLVMFATLVLVLHGLGVSNQLTVVGTSLFFYARVAHAVVYLAGIPWIRTAAFFVGFVGIVMLLVAIFDVGW